MIYYHDVFESRESYLLGVITYAADFERVILPEFLLMDTGAVDIDYCIGAGESWELRKTPTGRKHIAEWCNNHDFSSKVSLGWLMGVDAVIVHTRAAEAYFNSLGMPGLRVYFIKQSIDLSVLPSQSATPLNRWLYFGNLNTVEKQEQESVFRQAFLNKTDTLSFGQLNGDGIVRTHDESLQLVSKYLYAAGVGRCLLEALGMGLKCFVLGNNYGGPIRNDMDLLAHLEHNCNSTYFSTSTGNLNTDYNQLMADGVITKSLIDMKNRIDDYKNVINDILENGAMV